MHDYRSQCIIPQSEWNSSEIHFIRKTGSQNTDDKKKTATRQTAKIPFKNAAIITTNPERNSKAKMNKNHFLCALQVRLFLFSPSLTLNMLHCVFLYFSCFKNLTGPKKKKKTATKEMQTKIHVLQFSIAKNPTGKYLSMHTPSNASHMATWEMNACIFITMLTEWMIAWPWFWATMTMLLMNKTLSHIHTRNICIYEKCNGHNEENDFSLS